MNTKKEAGHTPGPWGVTRLHGVEYVTIDGGRVSVARVSALKTGEANARLIAAAPDLMSVVEVLLETPEMGGTGGVDYLRLEKAARAAITKAKGK